MARLITKKSTVAAKVPLAADLEIGELAVNTADAKIYTKHSDGNVVGMKAEPLAHTHTIADTPGLQAVLDAAWQTASASVYIQEADPMAATPYIWFRTDAMGVVIDILKG